MKAKKILLIVLVMMTICSCGNKTHELKLIPYKAGDLWGYLDKEGKIVINPQFKQANVFVNGMALVSSPDSKYGYIGEDGKYIINPTYKHATSFSEGYACVVAENGKPQFIDKKGEVKFTAEQCQYCGVFNEGLALAKIGEQWGYLDISGKTKIPAQFDYANPFVEGMASVAKTDKEKGETLWGFINEKGELIVPCQFQRANSFSEGLSNVYDGKKYGYIDKTGKYIINPQFDNADDFINGMAIIIQGSLCGFINKEGKIVINPQFKSAMSFSIDNNIAPVISTDGKVGYIDKEGKYVINPQFENGTYFYNDIAFVCSASKWGIIDKKGKYIVNPQFDKISVDFDRIRSSIIESDYFDIPIVVEKFLEGTDSRSFRKLNEKTVFSDIDNAIPDGTVHLAVYGSRATTSAQEELDKLVFINQISYSFTQDISSQKPIYRTVRQYSANRGGYYNQQVFDHYENNSNTSALLSGADYTLSFSGKALEKKIDIMNAIADAIAIKIGLVGKIDNSGSTIAITNGLLNFYIYKDRNQISFYFSNRSNYGSVNTSSTNQVQYSNQERNNNSSNWSTGRVRAQQRLDSTALAMKAQARQDAIAREYKRMDSIAEVLNRH